MSFFRKNNKDIDEISREAMDEMIFYDWPANLRDLEDAVERAVAIGRGRKIFPRDLPIFRQEHMHPAAAPSLKSVVGKHTLHVLSKTDCNTA